MIETHARAFLTLIILGIATVIKTTPDSLWLMFECHYISDLICIKFSFPICPDSCAEKLPF